MQTPPENTPLSVKLLGYGGLIPFIGGSLCQVFHLFPELPWDRMVMSYGAIILSFLGGIHWAFAMTLKELSPAQQSDRFVWSVIPSLIAWSSLALPLNYATTVLILGFVAHFLQDVYVKKLAFLPAWYIPLRVQLSAVACVCLLINNLLAHQ
jgi:hypothetical protein